MPFVILLHSYELDADMNPRVKIAAARTPDGGEMVLYEHDRDFSITINGQDLMNSRQHESELQLARLGCAHLAGRQTPSILIGGLGMGYTLRQALDMLSPRARIMVAELLGAVVDWNRAYFGKLNGQPLADERVDLKTGDIVDLISRCQDKFDAILLDIDNGPNAMTDSKNRRLYGLEGIQACRRALRKQGCLAVWSAQPSKTFERRLVNCNFHVRRFRVPAYKKSKAQSRFVWVASEDKTNLPPGGGEPRLPPKNESRKSRGRLRKRPSWRA
jgi:spermidine synthase